MTEAEKDVRALRAWCGSDFPYCFDVEVKESDGTVITTEIAGGEEFRVPESYDVAKDWDELMDMASVAFLKKNGYRIVSILNYQTNNPIIFRGSHEN